MITSIIIKLIIWSFNKVLGVNHQIKHLINNNITLNVENKS